MPFESYSTLQSLMEGKTFEERKRVYAELHRHRQAKNKPPPPPRPPVIPDPELPAWPYWLAGAFALGIILLMLAELAGLVFHG